MVSAKTTLTLKSFALLLAAWTVFFFVRDFRASVFLKQAASLAEASQWPQAEEMARAALHQNPTLGLAWYYKGAAEAGQNRTEDAASDLRRAIPLTGNPSVPQLMLGEILANAGKWTEARAALEAALLVNPKPRITPERCWQLLAECRRRTGDPAGTVPALWMAAATSNFAPGTLLPLSEAYRALGHNSPQFPDSLSLYFAQTYAPDSALKRSIITHYEDEGRQDLAIAFFESLISRGKSEPRDHLGLALYYNQLHKPQKALEMLSQAASALAAEPLYFYATGQAAEQLGNTAAMRQAYQRYLELSPNASDRAAIEAKLR